MFEIWGCILTLDTLLLLFIGICCACMLCYDSKLPTLWFYCVFNVCCWLLSMGYRIGLSIVWLCCSCLADGCFYCMLVTFCMDCSFDWLIFVGYWILLLICCDCYVRYWLLLFMLWFDGCYWCWCVSFIDCGLCTCSKY